MIADFFEVEAPSVVAQSEEPLQSAEDVVAELLPVSTSPPPEPLMSRYEAVRFITKGCRKLRISIITPEEFAYVGQMTESQAVDLMYRLRDRANARDDKDADPRRRARAAKTAAEFEIRTKPRQVEDPFR